MFSLVYGIYEHANKLVGVHLDGHTARAFVNSRSVQTVDVDIRGPGIRRFSCRRGRSADPPNKHICGRGPSVDLKPRVLFAGPTSNGSANVPLPVFSNLRTDPYLDTAVGYVRKPVWLCEALYWIQCNPTYLLADVLRRWHGWRYINHSLTLSDWSRRIIKIRKKQPSEVKHERWSCICIENLMKTTPESLFYSILFSSWTLLFVRGNVIQRLTAYKLNSSYYLLHRRRRLCFYFGLFVCLCVR